MGAKSTRKGKVWERRVVTWLEERGLRANRVPAVLESMGGPTGVDVRAWAERLRLAVQCKVGARPDVWGAVIECERGAHGRDMPVAFIHRNRAKGRAAQTLVAMSPAAFARLIDKANA